MSEEEDPSGNEIREILYTFSEPELTIEEIKRRVKDLGKLMNAETLAWQSEDETETPPTQSHQE